MKSALLHPAQGNLQKNFLFGTNAGGSMGGLGLSLIPFQLSLLDKVHICNNFLLTRMSTPLFMASRSSNSILMDLQRIWYQAEYIQYFRQTCMLMMLALINRHINLWTIVQIIHPLMINHLNSNLLASWNLLPLLSTSNTSPPRLWGKKVCVLSWNQPCTSRLKIAPVPHVNDNLTPELWRLSCIIPGSEHQDH